MIKKNNKIFLLMKRMTNLLWTPLYILKIIHGKPPHSIKIRTIKKLAAGFNIQVFIETGTYLGETLHSLKKTFEELYSIELSEKLFQAAQKRFSNHSNIILMQGDSGKALPKIVKDLDEKALFWLDAHYSGGITARGELDSPIFDELQAIFKHPIQDHVILIDDADNFQGLDGYPTIDELKRFVEQESNYKSFTINNNIIQII